VGLRFIFENIFYFGGSLRDSKIATEYKEKSEIKFE